MQVRESGVPDSYHEKRAASSLVADCANPQRPPAAVKYSVVRSKSTKIEIVVKRKVKILRNRR